MYDFVEQNRKIFDILSAQYFPNPTDREDALQEARIKFMYVDLSSIENPDGWVWRSVSNLFNDIYKRERRTLELDQWASIGSGIDDMCPLAILEEEEEGIIVERKIDDLPEELSSTANMYYMKGMSYSQIADKLGIPEGTVASRMNTVRRYLVRG